MEQILGLEGKMLVGFFIRLKSGIAWDRSLDVTIHWFPLLGYKPIFHSMRKGLLGFVFNSNEDAEKVLALKWMWDMLLLTLHFQTPLFNPSIERLHVNPV